MERHLFGLALALLTFSTLSSPSLAYGGNVVLGGHCAVAYVAAQNQEGRDQLEEGREEREVATGVDVMTASSP